MPRIRMTILLAVAALAVALAGCGDSKKNEGATGSAAASQNPVPTAKTGNTVVSTVPIQVYSGQAGAGAVTENSVYVARSKAEVKSTLEKLGAGSAAGNISVPDFSSSQLVFVAIPPAELGTQMTISNVTPKNDKKFVVEAVVLPVGKGCKKSSKKESLFTVVQTEQLPGEPSLKIDKQRQSPCS